MHVFCKQQQQNYENSEKILVCVVLFVFWIVDPTYRRKLHLNSVDPRALPKEVNVYYEYWKKGARLSKKGAKLDTKC